MKALYAAVGLTALFTAASAHAGLQPGNAIYSSFVTSLPDQAANANFAISPGVSGTAGGPLAQEFGVGAASTLTSIDLRLSDQTPADSGSVMVYLVANNPAANPPLPTASGATLSGGTLLGTILDSSLPSSGGGCTFGGAGATINACNTVLNFTRNVTPGNYWIALVDGSDAKNGGSAATASGAVWWRSGDNTGLNAAGFDNAHVNTAGNLTSQTLVSGNFPNAFELQVNALQVNAPEPASLALLGTGFASLGLLRRRPAKRAAR